MTPSPHPEYDRRELARLDAEIRQSAIAVNLMAALVVVVNLLAAWAILHW